MEDEIYAPALRELQLALVGVQRAMIARGDSAIIVFEGRDAAGKGGTIKRITEYTAPRQTHIVALGKPSERERKSLYLQRYVAQLPAAGELTFFDRSWYNRAGVERVMGFCEDADVEAFFQQVAPFEAMLVSAGLPLFKYYLDIGRDTQIERIEARRADPLKSWKISAIDDAAIARFDDYTAARDEMLMRTSHPAAPWRIVRADDKRQARIHVFRDLLKRLPAPEGEAVETPYPDLDVVTEFTPALIETGFLQR